jgi:RNA polymerase sigma-B factor
LLDAFARTRDPQLREQLVERYLPLARHVAGRYCRRPDELEDLTQVACLGLIKAIDRYDPSFGCGLVAYAVPTMAGELRRHLRDHSWAVRPPRDLQERALLVDRTIKELSEMGSRSPTVGDVARHLELSDEDVLEAVQAVRARHHTSLSSPFGSEGDDDTLLDHLGRDDHAYEQVEAREDLALLIGSVLTEREERIIRLRFEHELTQTEIGAIVGISQMQVSRLLRQALSRLHATMAGRREEFQLAASD